MQVRKVEFEMERQTILGILTEKNRHAKYHVNYLVFHQQ